MAGRWSATVKTGQSGFTLIELVMVIILLGIIAAATSQFIRQGVGVYADSVGRDALQQSGRFAVERITRELRNALPGSIRVGTDGVVQCIEFMPISGASTYLQPAADSAITTLNVIDFGYTFSSGDRLAIYPIAANNVYGSPSAIATLTAASAVVSDQQTLTFNSHSFPNESPTQRFFIVTSPVSFCAADNLLTRHSGYSASVSQPLPPSGQVLLAQNIRLIEGATPVTVFDFTAGTPVRSGIVHLDLRFSDAMSMGEEWIRFSQDVFLRNTP